MRVRFLLSTSLLLVSTMWPVPRMLAATGESELPSSQFDVADKTQVPGSTLAPGHYSIRVLDHLTDRMVLQIDNDQGKPRSTFLALPDASIASSGTVGVIPYGDGKNAALRGFAFSNGTVLQFVYPKAQAVAIARANSTKVPAIDPPSEGMPADNKLTKNDMALVTLWLLSPTFVGSESKPTGVLAQRYQAAAQQTAQAPAQRADQTTQVAQAAVPAPAARPQVRAEAQPSAQPVQIAQATPRKPVLAHLPHTAGPLPLLWLFGGLSLMTALGLRRRQTGAAEGV